MGLRTLEALEPGGTLVGVRVKVRTRVRVRVKVRG